MRNRWICFCLVAAMVISCVFPGISVFEPAAAENSSAETGNLVGSDIFPGSSELGRTAAPGNAESSGNDDIYISGNADTSENTGILENTDIHEDPGDGDISDNGAISGGETPGTGTLPDITDTPDDKMSDAGEAPVDGVTADTGELQEISIVPEVSEIPEEAEITVFDQNNVEDYFSDVPENQELIDEIQSGDMIALVPVALEADFSEAPALMAMDDSEASLTALSSSQYEVIVSGFFQPQEMVKREVTRHVQYIDEKGVERIAPLYCLNASKAGVSDGTQFTEAAVQALNNTRIKKLLYFGYGGPGDISEKYDPTCEHISWSMARHRYLFTHCALSYEYARDTGRETVESLTHYGVFRFNSYIQSQTLPDRSGVEIGYYDGNGKLKYGSDVVINLQYVKKSSDSSLAWLEGNGKGQYMISGRLTVRDTGNCGNGITINRPAGAQWQLGYWSSEAKYSQNPGNPTILQPGAKVNLKTGCVFMLAFSGDMAQPATLRAEMSLREVKYMLVDGDQISEGSNHQDFGACVYQGETGQTSIRFIPAEKPPEPEYGSIIVNKKIKASDITWAHGNPVFIFTAEGTDILGNPRKYERTVEFTREGCTSDRDGYTALTVRFDDVPLGTYKVYEKKVLRYYLLDILPVTANVTVTKGTAPAYGPEPSDIAFGTAALTGDMPEAELTFINAKQRFDDYSHTSLMKNQIQIA